MRVRPAHSLSPFPDPSHKGRGMVWAVSPLSHIAEGDKRENTRQRPQDPATPAHPDQPFFVPFVFFVVVFRVFSTK